MLNLEPEFTMNDMGKEEANSVLDLLLYTEALLMAMKRETFLEARDFSLAPNPSCLWPGRQGSMR